MRQKPWKEVPVETCFEVFPTLGRGVYIVMLSLLSPGGIVLRHNLEVRAKWIDRIRIRRFN
jgi:hypothetical protein